MTRNGTVGGVEFGRPMRLRFFAMQTIKSRALTALIVAAIVPAFAATEESPNDKMAGDVLVARPFEWC
jgi:hypothetical protein